MSRAPSPPSDRRPLARAYVADAAAEARVDRCWEVPDGATPEELAELAEAPSASRPAASGRLVRALLARRPDFQGGRLPRRP